MRKGSVLASSIVWMLSAMFLAPGLAQAAGAELTPKCAFEAAKCGYVDANGNVVIKPKYDAADKFVEGRAKVRLKGFYGFIDEAGREVVPLEYDLVSRFRNGFAQLRKNNRTKLIDLNGKVLVPPEYDYIVPVDQYNFLVGKRYNKFERVRLEFRGLMPLPRGNWAVFDTRTGKTTEPSNAELRLLTEGATSKYWKKILRQFYLMDTNGTRLTEGFDHVQALRFDRAIVGRDGLRGAIDSTGKLVIPLKFENIFYFDTDKWTTFTKGGKFGFVDRDGKVVIEPRFDQASRFAGETAKVKIDGEWRKIGRSGKVLPLEEACSDGLTRGQRGDKFVILGPNGKPLNDETYSVVSIRCGFPTKVSKGRHKYGFVAKDGSLLTGRYYWLTGSFYDGVAVVRPSRGKVGIIDTQGNFILELTDVTVRVFSTGARRTGFHIDFERILLDRKLANKLAENPTLLLRDPTVWQACRTDGVKIRKVDSQFVYQDAAGKAFIRAKLDYASCFRDGTAWVAMPKRQKWCKIDKSGKVLEGTCRCGQPLASVFTWSPPPEGVSCYEHGLNFIIKLTKRR